MKLFDTLLKKLALSYLKSKISSLRKKNLMPKWLDGNNRLIVCIGFVLAGLYTLFTGHDVSSLLSNILVTLGLTDQSVVDYAIKLATLIAPLIYAAIASLWALWKMYKQHRAGAKLVELNSPIGVVKAAIADGSLRVIDPVSVPLVIENIVVTVQPLTEPVKITG